MGVNELFPGEQNRTTTLTVDQTKVRVHFGEVTAHCDEFIRDSEEIVGAVAWLRSPKLAAQLARRPCSIILNKEFELKQPSKKARKLADKLLTPARDFEACVRVIGDQSRGAFTGLMHHKFLVRLQQGIPVAVWNGSFNLTEGAGGNFENGMEIHDIGVAMTFYDEFRLLWEAAEPLNFKKGAVMGLPEKPAKPRKR